ncbi:MAG TPA: hydroxymethylbilane synthase [Gammaproteobacteria bacterium]|jgi:hydroxymethylbilane synthase|nr:hydroxymethylbilane synthase [Gammaproteobacteria bacterium]
MTKRRLVIATRESPLAIRQSEWVKDQLQKIYPHLAVELLGMTTTGDRRLDVTLNKIGGKGLFVKELEEALFDGRADIAVHSMKDVPMELPDGLCLPVICEREDPRDAFVSNQYHSVMELPTSATVGTASLRRQTQLKALRSDLDLQDLRGNMNTRLRRLDEGDFMAIILAAAGLKRLGFNDRIRAYLSTEESLPAAGQGALGIECREDNASIRELIAPLNHAPTAAAVTAERAVCRKLQGGCQVPIAAYAEVHHQELFLRALVSNRNGMRILRSKLKGKIENADEIGTRVGEELMQQGAEKILREFHEE